MEKNEIEFGDLLDRTDVYDEVFGTMSPDGKLVPPEFRLLSIEEQLNRFEQLFCKGSKFVTSKEKNPRSVFELMKFKQMTALYYYLDKIRTGLATKIDVLKVGKILAGTEGNFSTFPTVTPGRFADPETRGEYSLPTGVRVSVDVLNGVAGGDRSILQLFAVIGHECRHAEQCAAKEMYDELDQKEKDGIDGLAKTIINDYGKSVVKEEEIVSIIAMISAFCDDEEIDRIEKMSSADKKDFAKTISFAQYLSFAHEKEARQFGLDFTKFMFKQITNDPNCPKDIKDWITSQQEEILNLEKQEEADKNRAKTYEEFKKRISKLNILDVKKMEGIYKKIKERSFQIFQEDGSSYYQEKKKLDEFREVYDMAYSRIVDMLIEEKSNNEIKSILDVALKQEFGPFVEKVLENISERKTSDKKVISEHIFGILQQDDASEDCFRNASILSFLSEEELVKLVDAKIGKAQFNDVSNIVFCMTSHHLLELESMEYINVKPKFNEEMIKNIFIKFIEFSDKFVKDTISGKIDFCEYDFNLMIYIFSEENDKMIEFNKLFKSGLFSEEQIKKLQAQIKRITANVKKYNETLIKAEEDKKDEKMPQFKTYQERDRYLEEKKEKLALVGYDAVLKRYGKERADAVKKKKMEFWNFSEQETQNPPDVRLLN